MFDANRDIEEVIEQMSVRKSGEPVVMDERGGYSKKLRVSMPWRCDPYRRRVCTDALCGTACRTGNYYSIDNRTGYLRERASGWKTSRAQGRAHWKWYRPWTNAQSARRRCKTRYCWWPERTGLVVRTGGDAMMMDAESDHPNRKKGGNCFRENYDAAKQSASEDEVLDPLSGYECDHEINPVSIASQHS